MKTKEVTVQSGGTRTVRVSAQGNQQCSALTMGKKCQSWAIRGGAVCNKHGGSIKVVKQKAAVRAELSQWVMGDSTEDPGEVLLRLVTQSARRATLYALLLQRAYEGDASLPSGVQALIGGTFSATAQGDVYQTGEQIRGLVQLEAQERDRCANFATKAIAAGLAERQVRLHEKQGTLIIEAITAALDAAGLTGAARVRAQNAAADRLESITA
jgi:hypothetical protein